ncbi:FAD-dependent monooxygenase [Methylocystis sp. 9N]|uniref:FAD-dependent monooxygenase n=1 Tax=Methylocystis borbori TaxID=3118750 RepID=A0ABU7XCP5_9HYPH
MEMNSTPVLIVGGGLVGLSAAVFLAARGVPAVLVERHAGSSPLPRAMGFTTRTMELYRAVGLGDQIPQTPPGFGHPRRLKVESLAGKWASEEVAWTPVVAGDGSSSSKVDYSICTAAALAQDLLEPILRARAIELGADIRLTTRLMSFEKDEEGVTARMRQRDGQDYALRAQYVIAADGHASPIREALGIGRQGRGVMRTARSVLFRAPLEDYLKSGVSQFEIEQPGFEAMLTTYRDATQGQGRWLLIAADERDYDEAGLKAMIQKAVGRSDFDIEIIATGLWELSALIADRFALGRIFLAGDAAHTLPPARGGYGANTGIEDVHNLAWKIASVLAGESRPELLDSYDAERRPIAWLRHSQIFARPDYARYARPTDKDVPIIDDDAMELGQLYRSSAVLGAGADLPPALRPDQWAGQPGTRAPHVWVSKDGARSSTLDLVQPDWALLTSDERWRPAAQSVAAQFKVKLDCVLIGGETIAAAPVSHVSPLDMPIEQIVAHPAGKAALAAHLPQVLTHSSYATLKLMSLRQLLPLSQGQLTEAVLAAAAEALAELRWKPAPIEPVDPGFAKAFGIGPSGASLIRPDGYIAWRTKEYPSEPAQVLANAFQRVATA